MNELDLPPRRPLPEGTRYRALRTVLDGIDAIGEIDTAPSRRRTAPLVAAAVVIAVLGGIAAVALSFASGADELRPAAPGTGPSAVVPSPFAVTAAPTPAGNPLRDTGYVEPFDRCKAAVTSSGHAGDYPAVEGWTLTEEVDVHGGVDRLLIVDDAFLCFVSPTTVRVSRTAGVPVAGVEVVGVGPNVYGVLNPTRASVSWDFGATTRAASTEPVQAVQVVDEAQAAAARLSVVAAGSNGPAETGLLPTTAPAPAVAVTDRALLPRDSSTADGAALDDCVRPQPIDDSVPGLGGTVTGESEPALWQPMVRFDLPGGGYAISAGIGWDYAGLCVRSGDYHYWWSRVARSAELPRLGAIHLATVHPADRPLGGLFGVGADVVAAQLTRADGTQVPCEVTPGLALCVGDDASGLLTLTLYGPGFSSAQQAVSFEDI